MLEAITDDHGIPALRITGTRATQHVSATAESSPRNQPLAERHGDNRSIPDDQEAALVLGAIREQGFRVNALVEADVMHYLAEGRADVLLDAVRRAAECRAKAWGYVLAVVATFTAQPHEHERWRQHWSVPGGADTLPPAAAQPPPDRRPIAAPPEQQHPATSLKDQTIIENPRERERLPISAWTMCCSRHSATLASRSARRTTPPSP